MTMREKILDVLKDSDKALTIYELKDKLQINDIKDIQELNDLLRRLEDDVIVYHSNKDKYMLLENSHLRKGVMHSNKKGFGFVDVENLDDDVYVSSDNMNGAINDDIVLVEITSKMNIDRLEGRILKVIKRQVSTYVGEINFKKNRGYITLDEKKVNLTIEVDRKDSLNAVDGHKVVVELGKRINNHLYKGKVIEIIGHKNDPGVDILSIVYKYNINTEFPDDVKEQVKNMPMEVLANEYKNRKDLRNQVIFTIDGDDTRDIDDAISIKKLPNGHYELGVHIADVSYYVKEGSPLDNEAMERGTSVYLVDRVIPMLPHELSNGICSLNPNVKRGYIDFDVDEAKILVDEECHPTEVVLRERGTGEMMIEDFMIAANECVATHIYFMNLPFIYRVHEMPKEEKIRSYLSFIGTLGYQIPGDIKDFKPKSMQKLINYLQDKKEFKILSTLLLRSMQKAVYKPENLGHYGLASKCYTHFTSPIRRYPDTTVHRLLRTYLFNKDMSTNTLNHWEEKLVYVAEHSSSREKASVDCEREVEDMKMAEYMESHIGEEFEGMISSVTSFGMFVELDNLIEGLVPIKDMKDFFHYDEERMTLTGERSHIKYTIGDMLVVRVVRASKEEKLIDFEVVRKL